MLTNSACGWQELRDWLPEAGTKPIMLAPASPWENGFIWSFHRRLRDEFLDREEFESVADARAKASWWRREQNRIRPHSGLGYETPLMFSVECDHGLSPKTSVSTHRYTSMGLPFRVDQKTGSRPPLLPFQQARWPGRLQDYPLSAISPIR